MLKLLLIKAGSELADNDGSRNMIAPCDESIDFNSKPKGDPLNRNETNIHL